MKDTLRAVDAWREEEAARGVPGPERSFASVASGPARALLLHGAGGSPADFGPLAADLASSGLGSVCPLLPAHGLGAAGHEKMRFEPLLARALRAFDEIAACGPPPALIGQSLGAVLAIRVALERPVPRLVALAPALSPLVGRRAAFVVLLALVRPRRAWARLRWQRDLRRGIRETARCVPDLRCPLLVLHSTDDGSVSFRGARDLAERAGSGSVRFVPLHGQGHVLSLAPDRARVVAEIAAFLDKSSEGDRDRSGSLGPPP